MAKNLPVSAGDVGLIPESGRPPEVGNGNLLQYSYLETSMNRGAWGATVHGVTKSRAQLSAHTHTQKKKKNMGTHTHTHHGNTHTHTKPWEHTHTHTHTPWDSPGGLVVKTRHYSGCRVNPWFENKILHATQLRSKDKK